MDTGTFEDMVQAHRQEIIEFYQRETGLDTGQSIPRPRLAPLRKAIRKVLVPPEHRVGQINLLDYTE